MRLDRLPDDGAGFQVRRRNRKVGGYRNVATAPQRRTAREVVDFPPNTPVAVSLKYSQGRTVGNRYGERIMFTLADNRVMFLELDVAGRIEALGINVRESFTITRSPGRKGAPVAWDIARVPGEQPNGTLVVPALATAGVGATPKPPASSATPGGAAPRKQPGAALVDEANALVDSFAQVLERSSTLYHGRIKPDEVKALLITAYIQRNKISSVA
jgi:hypothetical protein